MEQLTKVRIRFLTVGFILGLIVFGVAVYLKKPRPQKPGPPVVARRPTCGQTPTIDVLQTGVAQGRDPFDICHGDRVKWHKAQGVDDFIVLFVDGTPFDTETDFQPGGDQDSVSPKKAALQQKPDGCEDQSDQSGNKYYCKYALFVRAGTKWALFTDPGGRVWQ